MLNVIYVTKITSIKQLNYILLYNFSLQKPKIMASNSGNNEDKKHYLNDIVINDYMTLINTYYESEVYIFDTFFYLNLVKRGFDLVKKWTKKIDLFSKKKLIFPIHLKDINHWVLACANMETKEIKYFDSLYGYDYYNIQVNILEYLRKIHLVKVGTPFCTDHWTLTNAVDIPTQKNSYDCGVFVCTFAEYLARDAKFNFLQTHMELFRQLILYELLKKKLVPIDVDTEEIESFIRKVINQ